MTGKCCQPREVVPLIEPRAPRRVTSKMAVEKAEAHVRRRLKKYIVGLETLATGVVLAEPARRGNGYQVVLRDEETGEERVVGRNLTLYTTPPNLAALQYLSDRAMGKVPQRYEITGDEGGPMEIIPWLPSGAIIEGEYNEVREGRLPERVSAEAETPGQLLDSVPDATEEAELPDEESGSLESERSFTVLAEPNAGD